MTPVFRTRTQFSCCFLHTKHLLTSGKTLTYSGTLQGGPCSASHSEEPWPMVRSKYSFGACLYTSMIFSLPVVPPVSTLGCLLAAWGGPRQSTSTRLTGPGCFLQKSSCQEVCALTTRKRTGLRSLAVLFFLSLSSSFHHQNQANQTQKSLPSAMLSQLGSPT